MCGREQTWSLGTTIWEADEAPLTTCTMLTAVGQSVELHQPGSRCHGCVWGHTTYGFAVPLKQPAAIGSAQKPTGGVHLKSDPVTSDSPVRPPPTDV